MSGVKQIKGRGEGGSQGGGRNKDGVKEKEKNREKEAGEGAGGVEGAGARDAEGERGAGGGAKGEGDRTQEGAGAGSEGPTGLGPPKSRIDGDLDGANSQAELEKENNRKIKKRGGAMPEGRMPPGWRPPQPLVRAGGYGITSRGPMRLSGNDVGPPLCIWTKLDKGYSLSGGHHQGPPGDAPPEDENTECVQYTAYNARAHRSVFLRHP